MKRLQELKQSWMTQPAVREAYEAQAAEFSITRELIAARLPDSPRPRWPNAWAPARA